MEKSFGRCKLGEVCYVRAPDRDERAKLIRWLEAEGFELKINGFAADHEDVLNSIYPVTVYVAERKYDRMSNTLCAAAACSAGAVMEAEEFYSSWS